MYEIQKNITRLDNGQPTFFLDPSEAKEVKRKLGKNKVNVFSPFVDSEKIIYYLDKEPEVILYEIKCSNELRHQDILGTMFSLNISKEMYGDIILYDDRYFIYILKLFQNYFEMNFTKVRNTKVELKELDLDYLKDYERAYEELELIVSSERIDTIVSHLSGTSRALIKDKVKDKEILLNNEILKNLSYVLKENDTFSIRKIGKFKYIGVVKTTKSNNFIVKILKYI
jgi:RNA-binding protein YlmH